MALNLLLTGSGQTPDGLYLIAHGVMPCAGDFGDFQNPLKFLPYLGGPALEISALPSDRRLTDNGLPLVTQWRREINSSRRGPRLKNGLG
jgi:hypothetical protein